MVKDSVLVAGGAGFIGSHLSKRLIEEGYYPIIIDNLSTGRLWKLNELDPDDYTLIIDDIVSLRKQTLDAIRLSQAEHKIVAVFNLACPASPPAYQSDMMHTIDTCYIGTRELLLLADAFDAKYIQASTSECYGDPNVSPQPETYRGNVNTLGPRACYDEGKRVAESLIWSFVERTGLDARIARIFNTYGPAMNPDDGRVVTNFITQALQGLPLTIYGEGQQTRSFCYVDDLVDGLIKLWQFDRSKCENELVPVFNLGNDTEITINTAAEVLSKLVADAIGSSVVDVSKQPLPPDDPTNRRPDLSKAKEILKYNPVISYTEGFKKTVDYFVLAHKRLQAQEQTKVSI